MPSLPLRVAVISRSPLIRAGFVSLVGQLGARAVITDACASSRCLVEHDVAIFDLSAVGDMDASAELQRLLDTEIPVVGLVYEGGTAAASTDTPRAGHLVNMTVTA